MHPTGLCNRLEMNGGPQSTQSLQVVNLSEGWSPAGKQQGALPLQVVNLSEGCIILFWGWGIVSVEY